MQAALDHQRVSSIPLFQDLSSEQLSEVIEYLHRKNFPPGSTIMSAEQPGELIYIIESGTVKIHVEQTDGSEVITSILGLGDIVGEMSLLDDCARCADVTTLEASSLLWMDRRSFRQCLHQMPALTYNLARILTARLRVANEQIKSLATLEVECRVARQLLAFADRYGWKTPDGEVVIPIRLTQSDLAALVGATRERINQVIVSYKQRKYISVDQNHHFRLLKPEALLKSLDTC